ncbi:C1 family peptidase [Psychroserpens sp.]|jgi:C1A family cysteine protease|uniref:C1 family peptidase n=1 Tax=Psychroserpens sp. TaxID=2020870 RepID=UPI0039E3D0A7
MFKQWSMFFDENKVLDNLTIPNTLTEKFNLSPLLPPIGDQGRQGSCASWTTTYYLKSFQERTTSNLPYDSNRIMTPAYTYNQISQGICEGTEFENTLNILKAEGAVSLESFPYFDYSCNIQPNPLQTVNAAANKISDCEYLNDENIVLEMKTLITDQTPILISVFLTSQFGIVDKFGLTSHREHFVNYNLPGGCHAMLVVGYSDSFNAFKVVNSWREDWGDNGITLHLITY